ncbi:MAG: hypothetical protein M1816_003528 [Peltula sp. TS41687]|nr:MAG: hypothetical protein M1816_003528 [Peltula sp. TS41687]
MSPRKSSSWELTSADLAEVQQRLEDDAAQRECGRLNTSAALPPMRNTLSQVGLRLEPATKEDVCSIGWPSPGSLGEIRPIEKGQLALQWPMGLTHRYIMNNAIACEELARGKLEGRR